MSDALLFIRFFMPRHIADSHSVGVSFDNVVFNAVLIKQIHPGLSMATSGKTRFELYLAVDLDLRLDKSAFLRMDHGEVADRPSRTTRIQIASRFTCSHPDGLLS